MSFPVPEPVRVTGPPLLILTRSADQTVTWNGAAFDSQFVADLTIESPDAVLTCRAPAGSGAVTIPKSLLVQLGPAARLTLKVTGTLPGPSVRIELKDGSTLIVYASPSSSESRPVDIQ